MNKTVTLQQANNDDDLYIVDNLINTLEPRAGSVLTKKQVQELLESTEHRRGKLKIVIRRGNKV